MKNVATTGKRIGYGWLYNWYAVNNANGIAPDGWRVMNYDELYYLAYDILGGVSSSSSTLYAGGKMKSDNDYWESQSLITPLSGFNMLPAGVRLFTGVYDYMMQEAWLWTNSTYAPGSAYFASLMHSNTTLTAFPGNGLHYNSGCSVRCVQNKSVGESDGDTGTLTDVDGNVYPWVVIGDYRWMAENLRTTKYKNGNVIPEITDNTDWANDTAGARCAYNNDHYFVYPPIR